MSDPVCDTCNDTGWKSQEQRSLDPIPCPDCAETAETTGCPYPFHGHLGTHECEHQKAPNREEWEAKLAGIEAAIESCHEQIRLLRELEHRLNRQYGEVCKAGYGR